MRLDAAILVTLVSLLALAALLSRRYAWLRMVAILALMLSSLGMIAIAYLFGTRLAVARFERAGGEWTNELAVSVVPIVHSLLHPFYLVLAVWIVLLAVLALRQRPSGEA